MANFITAIHLTVDKKTVRIFARSRDFQHLDETKVYFGATLGQQKVKKELFANGDGLYKAEASLSGDKADTAIIELGTLDFHEAKKSKA